MTPVTDLGWRVAALDVGGSSIKGGVVQRDAHGAVAATALDRRPFDSNGPARDVIGAIAATAIRLLNSAGNPAGLAIGFPGPFDYDTGRCRIRGLAKFDRLYGLDVGRLLAEAVGRDVAVRFRNDAEAFALGEALFGAGRGFRRILCLTLGTGLGSAFVADGRRVVQGYEVPPGGELNQAPFGGRPADDVFSTRGLLARLRCAGLPGDIEQCAGRAEAGDSIAQAVLADFGADLGSFVAPQCLRFRTDAVIVGGGIARAWPQFGSPFRDRVRLPAMPPARPDEAALLGAALLFQTEGSSASIAGV